MASGTVNPALHNNRSAQRAAMRKLHRAIERISPKPEYIVMGTAGCAVSSPLLAYSVVQAISGQEGDIYKVGAMVGVGLLASSLVVLMAELRDYMVLRALRKFRHTREVPEYVLCNHLVGIDIVKLLARLGSKNAQRRLKSCGIPCDVG
ncbi:MAG: hypothetical protein N3H30_00450 [Candidatus Micrarchaeota archaeon]|nr:hypothetical protein [Candidatus Micrarchaeota archaeon]